MMDIKELLTRSLRVIQKSRSGYGDDYHTPEEYETMRDIETLLKQLDDNIPPEAKTEEAQRAYAYGWFKALEVNRG